MSVGPATGIDGPGLLHAVALLAIVLAGLALIVGLRRWAGRLAALALFLSVMAGIV